MPTEPSIFEHPTSAQIFVFSKLAKIPLHLTEFSLKSMGDGSNFTFLRRLGTAQESDEGGRSQLLQPGESLWEEGAGSQCSGTKAEMKKMHLNCIWR